MSSTLNNGIGCYTKDFAIYTDVPKYLDFIDNPKESTEAPKISSVYNKRRRTKVPEDRENADDENCGVMSSASSLVVGGTLSMQDQFPWLVAVFKKVSGKLKHSGAGTLVTNRHVVPRARTVGYYNASTNKYRAARANSIELYLGITKFINDSDLFDELGSAFVDGVDDIKIHPNAEGIPKIFNIAVITINVFEAGFFATVISPVCLWDFGISIDDQVGQIAYGVGYGLNETKEITGSKKHVPMKIDDMERCDEYWGYLLDDVTVSEYFCASGMDGDIVSDFDDPLYLKKNGRWYLRGLLSSQALFESNRSVIADFPVLYENTGHFLR